MHTDQHIVYGVTPAGEAVRLSRPMPWGEAIARWSHLTPDANTNPHGLRYLAVRAYTDPTWPASSRRVRPRNALGRFI